jgi:hypothetical protein
MITGTLGLEADAPRVLQQAAELVLNQLRFSTPSTLHPLGCRPLHSLVWDTVVTAGLPSTAGRRWRPPESAPTAGARGGGRLSISLKISASPKCSP